MTTLEHKKKAYRYGLAAEKYACAFLMCKGYRILAERHRNALGEIDILARRGNTLVAVEVKARRTFEQCEETVPPWKQQKIIRAVEGILAGHGKIAGLGRVHEHNIRFDVMWIVPWRWPRHIKDAWRV